MSRIELTEKSIEAKENMKQGKIKEVNEFLSGLDEQEYNEVIEVVSNNGSIAGYSL